MDISSCRDRIEISVVVQFACHPEQALVAQRGIWARRFVPARPERSRGKGAHPYAKCGTTEISRALN